MNKANLGLYDTLKAINELSNALISVLSFQFNLTKISNPLIINNDLKSNFNLGEWQIDAIDKYKIPLNKGLLIDSKYIDLNRNNSQFESIYIQEYNIVVKINDEQFNLDSFNKIVDKMFFCFKSASDFIEMLYFELNVKLPKELITIASCNDLEASVKDNRFIYLSKSNNSNFSGEFYAYDVFHNTILKIATIQYIKKNEQCYFIANLNMSLIWLFFLEKDHINDVIIS